MDGSEVEAIMESQGVPSKIHQHLYDNIWGELYKTTIDIFYDEKGNVLRKEFVKE